MTNRFSIATRKSEVISGLGFGARLVDHVTGQKHALHRLVSDGHGAFAPCGFDKMAQAMKAGQEKAAQILSLEGRA